MARTATKKPTKAPEAKAKPQPMDAIALLKADHRNVEWLFQQYENASGKAQKAKIAEQICLELSVHATIEEEVFYPACRGEIEDDLLDEAYVEHDGAKMLIAELMDGSPDEQFYDAKVKVLSEMIKHHVKEEEQREGMFAQAKQSDVDLDELGEKMAARKEELKADFKENGIPTPTTRAAKGAKLEYGEPIEA
jgi:hypothetical protein